MAQAESAAFIAQYQTEWCGGPVMVDGHYLPCVLTKGHTIDCEHDQRALRDHLARGADECRRCACLDAERPSASVLIDPPPNQPHRSHASHASWMRMPSSTTALHPHSGQGSSRSSNTMMGARAFVGSGPTAISATSLSRSRLREGE